jgi:hypothetical protein
MPNVRGLFDEQFRLKKLSQKNDLGEIVLSYRLRVFPKALIRAEGF